MRYALVIDCNRCTGCDSCVAACHYENNVDLGIYYMRVPAIGPIGTFPDIQMYWRPKPCQQCANPGCIEVCPTGASYRDDQTGVVLIDQKLCIGCKSCLYGCPFGVRTLNPATNTVQKCSLCFQRRNVGEWVPACVRTCCTGALHFGDLDDPDSDASRAMASANAQDLHHLTDRDGLGPSTVYILDRDIASWQDDPEEVNRLGY